MLFRNTNKEPAHGNKPELQVYLEWSRKQVNLPQQQRGLAVYAGENPSVCPHQHLVHNTHCERSLQHGAHKESGGANISTFHANNL